MNAENGYVEKGKVLISVLVSRTNIPFFVKKRLFEKKISSSKSAHQRSMATKPEDICGGEM